MLNDRISSVVSILDGSHDQRVALYQQFHQIPELSLAEYNTAALIEQSLRNLGVEPVRVGETGVVATVENGPGPVVAVRADIDALPVTERSGKDYASTATATNADGETVGVMHACGHDVHMMSLLGAVEALLARKDQWAGTFVAVFQPGEEAQEGARAMVDAGLIDAMPKPDVFLAQHVMSLIPGGHVATWPGIMMSAAASIKITIHGKGGHGSQPDQCIDPIVIASSVVLRLQTIVSREVAPRETAVVTVGAIKSGSKSNVIPDTATLLVNTRAFDTGTEKVLHEAIERIVRAECAASGTTEDPEFEYYDRFPLTVNDEDVTAKVAGSFDEYFGDKSLRQGPTVGSEDFSVLPDAFGVPYTYWNIGGFAGAERPSNHSPSFAPDISSIDTGAQAIIAASAPWLMR